MKPVLPLTLLFLLFITACSNQEKTVTTVAADGAISETALPKGHFIVDDETPLSNLPKDPTTFNGHVGEDTATSTVPIKENPEANLKRRYKNLLVFHADDTMKIKKSYIATLILGKDQMYGTLKAEALSSSKAEDEKVKMDTTIELGGRMQAKLMDGGGKENKGFEIEIMGGALAETQKITDKRKAAQWNWRLTPLTPGQQNLTLFISVIQKGDEGDEGITLPTTAIPILIFAEEESFMSKAGTFFEKNFLWLLGTLLIPLLLGWYNARMRHRFDKKIFAERDKSSFTPNVNQPAAQSAETPKETGGTNNAAN